MIHVIAVIRLWPGKRAAFIPEFRAIEPLVRAEAGCIEYGGAIDTPTKIDAQAPPRDDVVVVIEKWSSEAALAAHLEAPHMAEYRERVRGMVLDTMIRVLAPLS